MHMLVVECVQPLLLGHSSASASCSTLLLCRVRLLRLRTLVATTDAKRPRSCSRLLSVNSRSTDIVYEQCICIVLSLLVWNFWKSSSLQMCHFWSLLVLQLNIFSPTISTDHKSRWHVENQFCHKCQSKQSMADQFIAYLVPVIA